MNKEQKINLLAIESSCDDTSVAIMQNGKILCNIITGQEVHSKYGGVVPELASRSHQKNMIPTAEIALREADLKIEHIDGIAYTEGPGLLGSLLVGQQFAKGLSLATGKPLIAVNHLEAHVLSPLIENPELDFPYLCLLVSGGHTQIAEVESVSKIKILGTTLDDAAGEAFDKVAKLLGLKYPGGPLIDKLSKEGDPNAFDFNIGKVPELDFSFSGFKTSVLYFVQKKQSEDATFVEKHLSDLCASVQRTIVDYLLSKFKKAIKKTGINKIGVAGGVAANSMLRQKILALGNEEGLKVYIPSFQYCTDNAGMIANAAHHKFINKMYSGLDAKVFSS
ncbi:MAG: tRNA (adenosine(37)-N6)-threonylcarbamoyltransferase complex transferase subunit TsaD [Flavobacteriales bacterium]|nr:tRNA (adenosine(37)-N6)-threonylcarbamoyltransferase complex transferase subunit TsaD [Flavobacteriales bacterium]